MFFIKSNSAFEVFNLSFVCSNYLLVADKHLSFFLKLEENGWRYIQVIHAAHSASSASSHMPLARKRR